jgi:hypothetical protein
VPPSCAAGRKPRRVSLGNFAQRAVVGAGAASGELIFASVKTIRSKRLASFGWRRTPKLLPGGAILFLKTEKRTEPQSASPFSNFDFPISA